MAIVTTDNKHYQDIASQIRACKGSDETILPSEMASKVGEVFDAGKQAEYDRFWDSFQNYGNRKNYRYAFAGNGWTTEMLKPKHRIIFNGQNTTECHYMFTYMNANKEVEDSIDVEHITKMIDFSQCNSATQTFSQANIKNIYADFSNCDTLASTFTNSNFLTNIDNIYIKVSEKCTSFPSTFAYTRNLTTIRFLEGSVIAATISFAQSDNLTVESAVNIIETLKNYLGTDSEGVNKLTFSSTVWNRLEASGLTPPSEATWKDYVRYGKGWLYA